MLILSLLLACSSAQSGDPIAAVAVSALQQQRTAGTPVIVDVRTDAEVAAGRIPEAIHIPIDQLSARISELEPHRAAPVYLICAAGARSAKGAAILAEAGFSQPINVEGGMRAWQAAGYPIQ